MHGNTCSRVTFLINLMFRRLDKFDWPLFGAGIIFGMLIGLNIWGVYLGMLIYEGAY